MKIFRLKTHLLHQPNIGRDIDIASNASLYRLAKAILDAYGFDLDHAFGFFSTVSSSNYFEAERKFELFTDLIEEGQDIEPTGAESVKKTRASNVWRESGEQMLFLFDYGASWLFVVTLDEIQERNPGKTYPRVVKKFGRAPKQYD